MFEKRRRFGGEGVNKRGVCVCVCVGACVFFFFVRVSLWVILTTFLLEFILPETLFFVCPAQRARRRVSKDGRDGGMCVIEKPYLPVIESCYRKQNKRNEGK